MIDRRHFVQAGVLATGGMALPLKLYAAPAQATGPVPALLIHDTRFAASASLAAVLAGIPHARAAVDGDITRLWCDTLQPLWQVRGAVPVAGVTGEDVLFCLEQLAADNGLRVTSRQVLQHTPEQALVAWRMEPRKRRLPGVVPGKTGGRAMSYSRSNA